MKKAAFLITLSFVVVAAMFLAKNFSASEPVFHAKVVAKEAEIMLENDTVKWADFEIKQKPQRNEYSQTCQLVKANKKSLASKEVSEIGQQFEEALVNEIIPHWYGTTWSFDGHTDKPKQGEIACGYFVSTTLQHAGVNVNRYQLAQQKPENEAKSLAIGVDVIEIGGDNCSENLAKIRDSIAGGICFVGLGESHVGYLLKRKNELFFIHSSYISPSEVIIELAAKSPVFCAYNKYFIVELSSNPAFVERWLKSEQIEVIKNQ